MTGLTKFVAHLDQRSSPEWFYEALTNLPSTISVIHISMNCDILKVDWVHVTTIVQNGRLEQLTRFTLEIQTHDGQTIEEKQILWCK